MAKTTIQEERKLWKKGFKRVVGLDESGRGSLSGPVVAAAVMMDSRIFVNSKFVDIRDIKDSKKLSPKQREKIYKILLSHPAIEWRVGRVSEKVIDKINILEATKLAMKRAIKNLENKFQKTPSYRSHGRNNMEVEFLILDGKIKLDLPIPQKSIVKADERVFSCACASILAKVTRDRIMKKYHQKYPQYGFAKHKGYPTKFHLKMLRRYGPSKIHRKSFRPVRKIIAKF